MNVIRIKRLRGLSVIIVVACLVSQTRAQDDATMEAFREGQSLVRSEEFAKAAEILQKCVAEKDDFGPAWFLLGYSLHMDGKHEEALKAHRRAAEFEEDFRPIATYNIACAQALLGQPQESLQSLRSAIELGFDDAEKIQSDSDLFSIHPTTGFAKAIAELNGDDELAKSLDEAQELINQSQFDEAAGIYQSILEKDPKNDFACYRLGYALHGAGKLDEATKFHEKATEFPGTKGIAFYNWGCALSLKGEKEAALEKLTEAVKSGFLRLDAYENDPDLDNLREEQAFKDLVAQIQSKSKKTLPAKENKPSEDSSHANESGDAPPPFAIGIQMRIEEGEGVFVEEILPESAAERDGLQVGDRLVKVGDVELSDDPLGVLKPYLVSGEKIIFVVDRAGESKKIEVKPNPRK